MELEHSNIQLHAKVANKAEAIHAAGSLLVFHASAPRQRRMATAALILGSAACR